MGTYATEKKEENSSQIPAMSKALATSIE